MSRNLEEVVMARTATTKEGEVSEADGGSEAPFTEAQEHRLREILADVTRGPGATAPPEGGTSPPSPGPDATVTARQMEEVAERTVAAALDQLAAEEEDARSKEEIRTLKQRVEERVPSAKTWLEKFMGWVEES